jgi:hypothetical protein
LIVIPWGYKAGVVSPAQPTSSHTISYRSSASFPTVEKERGKYRNRYENKRELLSLRGVVSLSLPFHGRVELARVGGHARAPAKSPSQGYMTAVELATCRVPEDPASPALAGGYIVACTVFYE